MNAPHTAITHHQTTVAMGNPEGGTEHDGATGPAVFRIQL